MSTDPADVHRLALAVERLEGTMTTGFATVRGDINLLARAEHENGEQLDRLDTRVASLEARRFPLPTIGGVCGVAAVVLTGLQLAGRG